MGVKDNSDTSVNVFQTRVQELEAALAADKIVDESQFLAGALVQKNGCGPQHYLAIAARDVALPLRQVVVSGIGRRSPVADCVLVEPLALFQQLADTLAVHAIQALGKFNRRHAVGEQVLEGLDL